MSTVASWPVGFIECCGFVWHILPESLIAFYWLGNNIMDKSSGKTNTVKINCVWIVMELLVKKMHWLPLYLKNKLQFGENESFYR